MLVATLGNDRVDAALAQRGPEYRCPECGKQVILKRGTQVIAHFAHKRIDQCIWATGETRAHLDAKRLGYDEFVRRGLAAKLECVVDTMPGDRRADVMVWTARGTMVAFELQHTSIDPRNIAERASAYARADIRQFWIPFLPASVWKNGRLAAGGGWRVERYTPRPFELWVYEFSIDGMWMYDPAKSEFWLGRLAPHMLYREESSWYSEGGEENYGGGYEYESTRFKELTLEGPYRLPDLMVQRREVPFRRKKQLTWPNAIVAYFEPRSTDSAMPNE